MSDNGSSPAEVNGQHSHHVPSLEEQGLRPPAHYGLLRRLWWWFDMLVLAKLARLRFIAILVAIGAVIANWEYLVTLYERWTRPATERAEAAAGTEFWCPMHPTIVRDHPDKCPICGMPLSARKKGEKSDEALPPGVVSRVQLTPYRVALAGITTVEIEYRNLQREINAVGFVEYDERKLARITARASGKSRIDKLHANVTGQEVKKGERLAELYSPALVVTVQNLLDARSLGNRDLERLSRQRLDLWGIDKAQVDEIVRAGKPITHLTIRSPISGHIIKKYQQEGEYVEEGAKLYDVADLSTVWVEAQVYEDEISFLKEGLPARATTRAFPNRAFEGKLALIHPHLDTATRTLQARFNMENPLHDLRPGMYANVALKAPVPELEAFVAQARRDWRDQTAVSLAAHAPFSPALPCPGAGLPSLLHAAGEAALRRRGLILAVPERAVIDTGGRTLVYRESGVDVYDAVVAELGPRCGDYYPVLRGLQAGDRVVTNGSFLIDAETRLTAGAGSSYFGASGGPQGGRTSTANEARPSMAQDEESKVQAALAKLSAADRRLAQEQKYCPVLPDSRLGTMGVPVKVLLKGQPVFLCCRACRAKALANPDEMLAKVKGRKRSGDTRPTTGPEAKVRANLAKLPPADRKLAEAQRYCAVLTDKLLGSMGPPVKVMVKGRPVFVCCEGCEDEARDGADATLATVEKLKARATAERKKGGRR
jgi:Cu(I)/Ag(I) efflux system membrane fusion protein